MPSESKVWDRVAGLYARSPIKDMEAYQLKLSATQDYLRPGMRLLELGCGTGGTALAHATHVSQVTATDISARMIEIARDKAKASGIDNVSFQQMSVDEALQADTGCDVILAASILHLLQDPEAAIKRIRTHLQMGGYFVSNTPCLENGLGPLGGLIRLGSRLGLLPRYIKQFSEAQLIGWIESAGFKIVYHWRSAKGDVVFTIAEPI